jgi:ankyrin repeat protein
VTGRPPNVGRATQAIVLLALCALTFTSPLAFARSDPMCDHYEFRLAIAAGDVPKFDSLLKTCVARGVLPVDENGGGSLLHLAAHVGSRLAPDFMRKALAAGVDPNALSDDGITAMHMVARFGCADCVAILESAGASVMARDPDGMTPLHEAGAATIPTFIAAGADPLARDRFGNVPLHRVFHPSTLTAGVNVRNEGGLTPLHFAALAGNVSRIDALLAAGADPTLRTTKPSHWRSSIMSRSFGPGIPTPAGATAYDLARQRQKETRFVTHEHDAAVERLKSVTPGTGWNPFR